jgi:hypothetical protein
MNHPKAGEPRTTPAQSLAGARERELNAWQVKLLPLMVRTVALLAIFFFVTTFLQLAYLHWEMRQKPELPMTEIMSSVLPEHASGDDLQRARLRSAIYLEAHAIALRYQQASVLLMSRTWIRYLGFVTGMILAMVGATFILGKLRGPPSELRTEAESLTLSLKSASPGIMLAAFGVILMAVTIVTHHQITVEDVPIYLQSFGESGDGALPPLDLPAPLDDAAPKKAE